MNILLWIIQILLALLFLFAGVPKLIYAADVLQANAPPGSIHFSNLFLKFIGVCEVLGALGLVLPGLFRTRRGLTPLAALGLAILMIGAVYVSLPLGVAMAIIPFVALLLCAFVAYGRGVKHW